MKKPYLIITYKPNWESYDRYYDESSSGDSVFHLKTIYIEGDDFEPIAEYLATVISEGDGASFTNYVYDSWEDLLEDGQNWGSYSEGDDEMSVYFRVNQDLNLWSKEREDAGNKIEDCIRAQVKYKLEKLLEEKRDKERAERIKREQEKVKKQKEETEKREREQLEYLKAKYETR